MGERKSVGIINEVGRERREERGERWGGES